MHLVGAGPGDPELMTLRALRLVRTADILFHDSLIGPEILDFARDDAELVYVGKRKANHAVPQAEIGDLMIAAARAGKLVVRLKGGDPFIFGRGGEEIETLAAEGLGCVVVPGLPIATLHL